MPSYSSRLETLHPFGVVHVKKSIIVSLPYLVFSIAVVRAKVVIGGTVSNGMVNRK